MMTRARPIALAEHGSYEWHRCRANGIGASEAAAACGVSEYQTQHELWARKIGLIPPVEVNDAMLRGSELEPFIIRRLKERISLPLKDGPQILYRHPEHQWMLATPDGEFDDGGETILECKSSVSPRVIDALSAGEVAVEYLLQCQQQLAVTGAERCILAVLIPDRWKFFDLQIYTVDRNEALIAEIVASGSWLWGCVESGTEPGIDFTHRSALPLVKALYGAPVDETDLINLDDDAVANWHIYEESAAEIRALKERQDVAKARVLHAIGNHAAGALGDGRMVRRQVQTRCEYTVKAGESVVVRAVKIKKGMVAN